MEKKACASQKYGNYNRVEDAKSACSADSRCKGIYLKDCNLYTGSYHLCPIESGYFDSTVSCVRDKSIGKLLYLVNIDRVEWN